MSIPHNVRLVYNDGTDLTWTESISSGSENNISESIADATTNGLVAWACDLSQLKGLIIHSTQEITVYTNAASTGAPDDTFTIGPTSGIVFWTTLLGTTNPITVDVTALYVTNASGSAATLTIKKLEDPTV